MQKGPLVKVELQEGRYVKKYQEDAAKEGYVEDGDGIWRMGADPKKGNQKVAKPQETKIRKPQEDKGDQGSLGNKGSKSPEEDETKAEAPAPADDFESIDGVGPATARALAAHGVRTFDELRTADLGFLTGQALAAIQEWRSESGTGDV